MKTRGCALALSLAVVMLYGHVASFATTRARSLLGAALSDAPPRVGGGARSSCQVNDDGTVSCWGSNDNGQLGDGTLVNRLAPVRVVGISNAVAVAVGAIHACALLADGRVLCWGDNAVGQLGDGTGLDRSTPVAVSSIVNAMGLAAGNGHSCALLSNGLVRCWGRNISGNLGDGTQTTRFAPVSVINLTNAVALTAGNGFTCALTADGGARCWGRNDSGQLGDGTLSDRSTASLVAGLIDAVAIAAGEAHTCALQAGGRVRCWGDNFFGQLGDGTRVDHASPALVSSLLPHAAAIAAGAFSTCALIGSGDALCWGDNQVGQLGDGTATMRLTPVFVHGVTRAVALGSGDRHYCTILADGGTSCWGFGSDGELGNGATSTSFVAVTVAGSGGTVNAGAIAAGRHHTCTVRSNGSVSCWGDNLFGQLGDGTTTTRLSPTPVAGLLLPAVTVAAGEAHTCALLVDGTVRCWGDNSHGQLGDGTGFGFSVSPVVPIMGPPNSPVAPSIVSLVAGDFHTCALRIDGIVRCWGENGSGQIGDGTTVDRFAPVSVPGLGDNTRSFAVQAIAAGGNHTCALLTNGVPRCWGENSLGQLGDGTTTTRLTASGVLGITDGVAIAAGADHTCAILSTGSARCWGKNATGQIGNGTTTNQLTPATVVSVGLSGSAANGFTGIAAGRDHTCGVLASGGARCWGDNSSGEIGDGTTTTRLNPVDVTVVNFLRSRLGPAITIVAPLASAVQITAGERHTCAILAGGGVRCWGEGLAGQLGIGNTSTQFRPAVVPSFTLNIVPVVHLTDREGAATVEILAACEEGLLLRVSVTLTQGETSARGAELLECTGGLERYPVNVRAHGRDALREGPAEVAADAFIRDRGVIVESQEWTRRVDVSGAP